MKNIYFLLRRSYFILIVPRNIQDSEGWEQWDTGVLSTFYMASSRNRIMLSEMFSFAKYHTFYYQNKWSLSTCLHYQILGKKTPNQTKHRKHHQTKKRTKKPQNAKKAKKTNKGGKCASYGHWGLSKSPDIGECSVWNFPSWAGTCTEVRAVCSPPRDCAKNKFDLGLQRVVLPSSARSDCLTTHGGKGRKDRTFCSVNTLVF